MDSRSFDICSTESPSARVMVTCNSPDKPKKFTLLVQEVSPNPFGFEFQRGETYYLICKYLNHFSYFFGFDLIQVNNPESSQSISSGFTGSYLIMIINVPIEYYSPYFVLISITKENINKQASHIIYKRINIRIVISFR